jgi:hypothetical protein
MLPRVNIRKTLRGVSRKVLLGSRVALSITSRLIKEGVMVFCNYCAKKLFLVVTGTWKVCGFPHSPVTGA